MLKWVIVYILVNGTFSHEMKDVSDEATCQNYGRVWKEQMYKVGYDTETVDGVRDTDGYNRWADYECIQMPYDS